MTVIRTIYLVEKPDNKLEAERKAAWLNYRFGPTKWKWQGEPVPVLNRRVIA